MKRFFSVMAVVLIVFACCSCTGGKAEVTTVDSSLNYPPILGVHIRKGDMAGFYALTKAVHTHGLTQRVIILWQTEFFVLIQKVYVPLIVKMQGRVSNSISQVMFWDIRFTPQKNLN